METASITSVTSSPVTDGVAPPKHRRPGQPFPADLRDKRVLDTNNSAAFVGLSTRQWERERERGTSAPVVKLGKRKYGHQVCDLIAWIEARKQQIEAT